MNFKIIYAFVIFIGFSIIISYANEKEMKIKLKSAYFKEESFKSLLEKRYSGRDFQNKVLNLDDIASILWATGGKIYDSVTAATRTIPSAGATYPLELYLIVGEKSVDKLKAGVYHYIIDEHSLELIAEQDKRAELAQACLGQNFIQDAPVSLVIVADSKRTTQRYGRRGERYCIIEAGHACQNAYLAVTCLGLSTVEVGAFFDDQVSQVLNLDKDYAPLCVMPVGYAKSWGK